MELILDIVKSGKIRPKYKSLKFNCCDGTIGRGDNTTYKLTDANNYISSNHLHVEYKYGKYYIRDESTNGTYLKNPYKKLNKGIAHLISASEVYIIGDHELQARFSDDEYNDEYIVHSNTIIEEPNNSLSINELIPDDDFLMGDENILKEHKEEKYHIDTVLDFVEAKDNIIDEHIEEDFLYTSPLHNTFNQNIDIPIYTKQQPQKTKVSQYNDDSELMASIQILEQNLGIEIINLPKDKRDKILEDLASIVKLSLDGLNQALEIQDNIKQNLNLSANRTSSSQNNPIKIVQSATQLLQDQQIGQKLGMIDLPNAVIKSFQELNTHSIALHSASKNIMEIALKQFVPKHLEEKIESNGYIKHRLLPKKYLMWDGYCAMFDRLNIDDSAGLDILQKNFTEEYENISFSLNLTTKTIKNN